MPVETVGRYEILDELGRGAMGVVYKAKDPTIGRTVALKTMRLDVHGLDAAEMVRRFQNEARAAGVLSHPNVVTIYDAGEQDGIFYIAMEFIEGTTLHELLANQRILPADDVIQYSRQICRGLDYAQSHGIVHRDIKPANIMITANGTVKIMDFGIAKSGGSMTSTGQVLGTPNYMSPEQVKGRPLDGRSDLFSFGVILYEMLTGEKPFVGQNVTTIIYKIVNENPIAPRDLDVTVHPGLSAIVVRALAKSPDERYQSGADLVHDLESYKVTGAPMHATSVLPAATLAAGAATSSSFTSHEKTIVLPMKIVAGAAVRAPEPSPKPQRVPLPLRMPNISVRHNKKYTYIAALIILLLAVSSLSTFAVLRARAKARQIAAAEAKAREEARKPLVQVQQAPLEQMAVPAPPLRTDSNVIAHDTTVKFVKQIKATSATPSAPVLDPQFVRAQKALSSPNQVYAQQSEIQFNSSPAGAKVEIDGWSEPNWVTPFSASHLAAGYHTVSFSKAGYLQKGLAVESFAGKSVQASAELSPAVSTLVVTSNPAGANIYLDGKDTSQTTPSQLTVEKGIHRVIVRKAGFKDAAIDETLNEGQTISFSPVLLSVNGDGDKTPTSGLLGRMFGADNVPEGKGLVHIRTAPEGATITVDGKLAPKKTNARWPADPGVYTIVLEMAGYKPIHRNIRVQQGKVADLDEILEKQ
jgi:eukaryotic-like serine/threonine-protein kinase